MKNNELTNTQIVEVVLRKKMTIENYKNIISKSRKQGWFVQAYEIGRFSEGTQTKIEID
jgi:hypothetical protein